MLKSLSIKNYALIQDINIRFYEGLSVITGETGAGKSIMLGALNMISGKRADLNAIIDKSQKCIIEAQFKISNYGLEPFFTDNDLDFEDVSLVRREISPAGKSRAFINDTPVNLDVLKAFSDTLIDIHSQHENLLINDSSFQLQIIDGVAGNLKLLSDHKNCFDSWVILKNELSEIKASAAKAATDKDYYQFQLEQLLLANLTDAHEQLRLEEELEALNHAEDIKMALTQVSFAISDETSGAIVPLTEARNVARKNTNYHPVIKALEARLESVLIELRDIADEAELSQSGIEYSPERIELVTERLNLINDLLNKHRFSSVTELMVLRDSLDDKLQNISEFDDLIIEKQKAVDVVYKTVQESSMKLSESRKAVFAELEKKATVLLQDLGMPNACFKIEHKCSDAISADGIDKINFLFSSNKNEPQSLAKIASGGEKSRLMLALKSLISTGKSLPTIIFDEIDTGISGGIASKMAKIMNRMGAVMQVISITHLPQIAAAGRQHYKVFKTNDEHPSTQIKELSNDERLNEIASLLSSEKITDTALKHATELMQDIG